MSRVTMEAEILNRETIAAVSGKPSFLEIEVTNPFEKR